MRIVWDERKRESNLVKHGLDFADLSEDFITSALVSPTRQDRFLAIGRLSGDRPVAVVFRRLGAEAIAIVSMRRASVIERRRMDD